MFIHVVANVRISFFFFLSFFNTLGTLLGQDYVDNFWTHLAVFVGAPQVALVLKNPPATAGDIRDLGLIPGSGRSPEEEMATQSSILAWRIPWTREAVHWVLKTQT